ncbi:MAG TPA: HAMP domain-containing sensor histidine kinase [Dehalococcoidia bacterium]|nr:HAMP domain-containing sensor histidine kinase [Dehalococcoidia bacterium]
MLHHIVAGRSAPAGRSQQGAIPPRVFKRAWLRVYGVAAGGTAAATLRLIERRNASISVAAGLVIVLLATVAALAFAARTRTYLRQSRRPGAAWVVSSLFVPAAILLAACQLLLFAGLVPTVLVFLEAPLLVATWTLTPGSRPRVTDGPMGASAAPMAILDSPADADEANPETILRGLAKDLVACSGFERVHLLTPSDDRRALVVRAMAAGVEGASDVAPAATRLMIERLPVLAQALASGAWQTFAAHETSGLLTGAIDGAEQVTTVVGPLDGSEPSRGLVVALARPTDSVRDVTHRFVALRVELARRRPLIAAALARDLASQIALPFGRLLLDLPSPLLLLNRYTRVIVVNAAAEKVLGRTAAELVGRRLCAGAHECDCVVHRALHGEGPVHARLNLLFAGLLASPATGLATVWAIATAEDSGLIAIGLPNGSQEHEAASTEDLSGFDLTAIVAHDLRSPLSALRMASRLAGEEDVSAEDRLHLIASIERLVDRTDRIATDLLDAYRASAGQLGGLAEVINLRRCCAELVDELGATAADGPHVELRIDPALAVTAERAKLRTVLRNLLTNAIKHTSPEVRIEVAARYSHGQTQITVRDGGPGVAAEQAPFLFERFFRGGTAGDRPEGHGLGLFIAQRFVVLMGGRIWIEPPDGRGAAFSFTIPDRPAASSAPPPSTQQAVAGC